jgi:hypothetical protein
LRVAHALHALHAWRRSMRRSHERAGRRSIRLVSAYALLSRVPTPVAFALAVGLVACGFALLWQAMVQYRLDLAAIAMERRAGPRSDTISASPRHMDGEAYARGPRPSVPGRSLSAAPRSDPFVPSGM